MRSRLPFTKPCMRKKDVAELIHGLREDLRRLQERYTKDFNHTITRLSQLDCADKGHKFVFDKITTDNNVWCTYSYKSGALIADESNSLYQFKCLNCELTITKTEAELTVKEKNALKVLGILK